MDQNTECMKLPLEESCAHKSWRAHLCGYEECVKTFQCIDNEKSPEWNKYIGFKLPKDFYEKVEAKKWQVREEALEALETLVKNPKLENGDYGDYGDYGDVVRALKNIILNDSNVVVVTLAGKCLAVLAKGLKKRFQPYATACLPIVLEKFREKKKTVVQALRELADAIYESISIDLILEDTLAALDNKNPAVKAETAAYLARCFARTPPSNLNKKLLKSYTSALLKTLNRIPSRIQQCVTTRQKRSARR
ncbi:Cytoskeleton-associated protein 5-A [Formica fusca]